MTPQPLSEKPEQKRADKCGRCGHPRWQHGVEHPAADCRARLDEDAYCPCESFIEPLGTGHTPTPEQGVEAEPKRADRIAAWIERRRVDLTAKIGAYRSDTQGGHLLLAMFEAMRAAEDWFARDPDSPDLQAQGAGEERADDEPHDLDCGCDDPMCAAFGRGWNAGFKHAKEDPVSPAGVELPEGKVRDDLTVAQREVLTEGPVGVELGGQEERAAREKRLRAGGPMLNTHPVAPDTIWRCPVCGHITDEEGDSNCPYCLGRIGDDEGDLWQPYIPASKLTQAEAEKHRDEDSILHWARRAEQLQADLQAASQQESRYREGIEQAVEALGAWEMCSQLGGKRGQEVAEGLFKAGDKLRSLLSDEAASPDSEATPDGEEEGE